MNTPTASRPAWGYTGGDVPNAKYRNHANHAEAIEISFDPEGLGTWTGRNGRAASARPVRLTTPEVDRATLRLGRITPVRVSREGRAADALHLIERDRRACPPDDLSR